MLERSISKIVFLVTSPKLKCYDLATLIVSTFEFQAITHNISCDSKAYSRHCSQVLLSDWHCSCIAISKRWGTY